MDINIYMCAFNSYTPPDIWWSAICLLGETNRDMQSPYLHSTDIMVEARGVEPLSEGPKVRLSPGAERVFKPFPSAHPHAQGHAFGSFIIPFLRSKLCGGGSPS